MVAGAPSAGAAGASAGAADSVAGAAGASAGAADSVAGAAASSFFLQPTRATPETKANAKVEPNNFFIFKHPFSTLFHDVFIRP
jgi:hypothetical protein